MEQEIAKPAIKWYLRPAGLLIAMIIAGPLAIPLVWMSPAIKKWLKVALTVLLVLFTVWFLNVSVKLYNALNAEMQSLEEVLKH